jgi:hypothetical protein
MCRGIRIEHVPCRVVGVRLPPTVCPDAGDTAHAVQVETAGSSGQFAYLVEVAVRTIGVGPVLEKLLSTVRTTRTARN